MENGHNIAYTRGVYDCSRKNMSGLEGRTEASENRLKSDFDSSWSDLLWKFEFAFAAQEGLIDGPLCSLRLRVGSVLELMGELLDGLQALAFR
jgi:hypothetical protein